MLIFLLLGELESIYRSVNLQELCYRYDSFFNSLNGAHLKQFFVPALDVTFLVTLGWLHPKRKGTLEASVFLVTVLVCAVIVLHRLKVRLRAMCLEEAKTLLVLGLNKVLDMRSVLLSFFKLTSDEDYAFDFAPGLKVLPSVHLGVVESSNHHSELCHVCRRLL